MLSAVDLKRTAEEMAYSFAADRVLQVADVRSYADARLQEATGRWELEEALLTNAVAVTQKALRDERSAHQAAASAAEVALAGVSLQLQEERADSQAASENVKDSMARLSQQLRKEQNSRIEIEVSLQQRLKELDEEKTRHLHDSEAHSEAMKQLHLVQEGTEKDAETKFHQAKSEWEAEEARLIETIEAEYGTRKAAEAQLLQACRSPSSLSFDPDAPLRAALKRLLSAEWHKAAP